MAYMRREHPVIEAHGLLHPQLAHPAAYPGQGVWGCVHLGRGLLWT